MMFNLQDFSQDLNFSALKFPALAYLSYCFDHQVKFFHIISTHL